MKEEQDARDRLEATRQEIERKVAIRLAQDREEKERRQREMEELEK